MADLDLAAVRARFPALADGGPVHADAPGGTQVVGDVIDAMAAYLRDTNANTHGPFPTSAATDALCARVREQAGHVLGSDPAGIVFGPNMTTLTIHLSHAFDSWISAPGGSQRGSRPPSDHGGPHHGGPNIVCTRLDHDANVSPWLGAARRTGAEVRFVDLRPDGTLDVDGLDGLVDEATRLVTFPRASNALGTVVDPEPFVAAARRAGALSFCDAVHAAPHLALDRQAHGIDVLVCSPYKFFGPHAGLLAADPSLLSALEPDKVRPAPDAGPERWQTGTASFEAIAGVGAALAYLDEVGMDAIGAHEAQLTRRFLDGLGELDHVRLHGPPTAEGRTPTFAVTVDGRPPAAVSEALAADGVYTWPGHYYAVEPLGALGLLDAGGAVRIGFVHYHSVEDVDHVLASLARFS